jgi:diguanylate cyclase (GGDEF)-like protein
MTPTIILLVLVGQIALVVVGGLVWLRQGSPKVRGIRDSRAAAELLRDQEQSQGILARLGNLLSSHSRRLDALANSVIEAPSPSAFGEQLGHEVDELDMVLECYEDLYHQERAELRDYAEDASLLDALIQEAARSPQAQQQLRKLVLELQQRNASLQSTVRRCQAEISDLLVQVVRAQSDSRVDALTRLPNHRAWAERREAMLREQLGVAVVLLDVDRLKLINRDHGREAGDALLKLVAKILRETMQASVYRRGGDKFVILLPSKTVQDAVRRADGLRARIEKAVVTFGGQQLSVTASCGVAQFYAGANVEETLWHADEAVRQAKEAGRNRVVGATEDSPAAG